jgi:hypothetical protein
MAMFVQQAQRCPRTHNNIALTSVLGVLKKGLLEPPGLSKAVVGAARNEKYHFNISHHGDVAATLGDSSDSTVTPEYTDYSDTEGGSSPGSPERRSQANGLLAHHMMSLHAQQQFCRKRRMMKDVEPLGHGNSNGLKDFAVEPQFVQKAVRDSNSCVRSAQDHVNRVALEIDAQTRLHREALSCLEARISPSQRGMARQTCPVPPQHPEQTMPHRKETSEASNMVKRTNRCNDRPEVFVKDVASILVSNPLQQSPIAVERCMNQMLPTWSREKMPPSPAIIELNIHDAIFRGSTKGHIGRISDEAVRGQSPCIESVPLPKRLLKPAGQHVECLVPTSTDATSKLGLVSKRDDRDTCERPMKIEISELSGQKLEWDPAFPCKLRVPEWHL